MRLAFFLLLAVNIAFFVWAQLQSPPTEIPVVSAPPQQNSNNTIRLLHEVDPGAKSMADIMESKNTAKPKRATEPKKAKEPDVVSPSEAAAPPTVVEPPPMSDIEKQVAAVEARHNERIEATLAARARDDQARRKSAQIAEAESPSRNVAPAVQRVCYSLGPFGLKADALDVAGRIVGLGQTAVEREEQVAGELKYWVIDVTRDTRAAQKRVKELAEKKVEGAEVVTEGEYQGMVLLGSYNDESAAQARLNEIVKLGFRPVLEKRTDKKSRFWVDVEENDRRLSPAQLKDVIGDIRGIDKREKTCR